MNQSPKPNPHLRVLYCILDNRVGGPHRLALTMAHQLRHGGVEMSLLTGYKTDEPWQTGDIALFQLAHIQCIQRRHTVLNLLRFLFFLPANLLAIRRIIKTNHIDIVHVDGIMNILPALAAKLCRRPIVWTYNDYITAPLKRLFLPIVARWADTIILQGERIRERLPANDRRIDSKIAILPSAVNPAEFVAGTFSDEDRHRCRAEFDIPADHQLVTAIGNINIAKGHEYFLEAAAAIKAQQPKVKFLIVGRKLETALQCWDRLQQLVDRLGLRNDVVFAGFRTDIDRILHATDVFVLSSVIESCPVAVLEAMAMEVPIVATDVGAVPELLVHGQSALIVPARDAEAIAEAVLTCLQMSPAERTAMTEAARRRIETELSAAHVAERQKAIYETLI